MSGAYVPETLHTNPSSTAAILDGKERLTAVDIHTSIGAGPADRITTIALNGIALDNSALEVLAEHIPSMTSLVALAFTNCQGVGGSQGLKALLSSCCGSQTLEHVVLSGCGLQSGDVSFIASDVAPWSETIIDWDLSNNSAVGGPAIAELVTALASRTVRGLNFTATGINDQRSVSSILAEIPALPTLTKLGLGGNSGISPQAMKPQLTEVDEMLRTNAEYSGTNAPHTSIITAMERERKSPAASAKLSPTDADGAEPAPKAPKKASPASSSSSVIKRGASPAKKRSDSPSAQAPASGRSSTPTSSTIRRGNSPARRPAATAAPTNDTPSRRPSLPRAATPTRATGSPARSNASPARSVTTQALNQRQCNDGYQEWMDNKAKYNNYIGVGVKKKSAEEQAKEANKPKYHEFKYAFGKSVDKVRNSGSRAATNTMLVRDPTARELREMAPWVTDRSYVSNPGRKIYLDDPTNPGGKIRFVDGGEVRAVENDPREIGFIAKKRENGQLTQSRSGGFASSTPRECRFGTDASNQIMRTSQAPGPGYYVLKSQFEINAEKAKVNATNRPGFGSRSERAVFASKKKEDDDKPVYIYELP